MIDIEELYTVDAHEAGAEMCVNDKYGNKTEMFITFVGVDSDKWDDIKREFQAKRVEAISKDDFKLDNKLKAEMIASAALGWRGFNSKGVAVEFTKESLVTLLTKAPYIWDQANLFIVARVNFTKG